jgi:hypothetical protein
MNIKRAEIIEAIGGLKKWHHNCHAASLAIVRSGLLPKGARVARGLHPGAMPHQHSWVAVGDPYTPDVMVVDATLWSYNGTEPSLLTGGSKELLYRPHGGQGNIWDYGRPAPATGKIIRLRADLSGEARRFLDLLEPGLDIQGWRVLAHAPVAGWPAAEIIGAMYDDERLSPLVPIDVVGMITDRNPNGLYW